MATKSIKCTGTKQNNLDLDKMYTLLQSSVREDIIIALELLKSRKLTGEVRDLLIDCWRSNEEFNLSDLLKYCEVNFNTGTITQLQTLGELRIGFKIISWKQTN